MNAKGSIEETTVKKRERIKAKPVPGEGEDGLFTESWFPVCMSSEVLPGRVIGRSFLDGRIVIVRGEDEVARVFSAFCPHLGADLAAGKVVGNRIQCGFHHWEYNTDGWCEMTGLGDRAPTVIQATRTRRPQRYKYRRSRFRTPCSRFRSPRNSMERSGRRT